ncbi:unnamed protein product [Gadus morhua 'NCC']
MPATLRGPQPSRHPAKADLCLPPVKWIASSGLRGWPVPSPTPRVGAEVAASYSPLLGTHDGAVLGLSDGSQGARNDCAQPFYYVAWHSSALAFL